MCNCLDNNVVLYFKIKKLRFEAKKEIGPQSRVDTVYMNVTDAGGNMLPVQLFTITTTPVNNQSPQLRLGNTILVSNYIEHVQIDIKQTKGEKGFSCK